MQISKKSQSLTMNAAGTQIFFQNICVHIHNTSIHIAQAHSKELMDQIWTKTFKCFQCLKTKKNHFQKPKQASEEIKYMFLSLT